MPVIDTKPVLDIMDRIATALERIADSLETEYHVSLEHFEDRDGIKRTSGDIQQCSIA